MPIIYPEVIAHVTWGHALTFCGNLKHGLKIPMHYVFTGSVAMRGAGRARLLKVSAIKLLPAAN